MWLAILAVTIAVGVQWVASVIYVRRRLRTQTDAVLKLLEVGMQAVSSRWEEDSARDRGILEAMQLLEERLRSVEDASLPTVVVDGYDEEEDEGGGVLN